MRESSVRAASGVLGPVPADIQEASLGWSHAPAHRDLRLGFTGTPWPGLGLLPLLTF